MKLAYAFASLLALAACKKQEAETKATPTTETKPSEATPAAPTPAAPVPAAPKPEEPPGAKLVGKPAPDFALKDLDGKEVTLASFKGKTVVLEWWNPECPYVKKSHSVGSLVDTAEKHIKAGVVWLAINSGGPGQQGYEPEKSAEALKAWKLSHPVLRDEDGAVGHAYGATNTPNLFVIDANGVVQYAGAIDNSPDGERKSPTEGTEVINYVDAALEDLSGGKPVRTPSTKPYGCSVKYAS